MPPHDDAAPEGAGSSATHEGPTAELLVQDERSVLCRLAGDLDIESLLPARRALDQALADAPALLVVDLERIRFCDSSGLNLLLKTRAAALAAGTALRLAAASTAVLRLLEITGAQAVFDLHPTVRAALAEAP
ncbi:STAS domain-containing protein [Kitasatospora sp. NPDC051853]|uniref:STAS domain-containing protein n=1 Tax=Kitasatospora sp. NPDC051853 TaxID=3364058 RepID=UPI0037A4F8C3